MLGSGAFSFAAMSFSLILWLFLAITMFWGVGVYNRLVRLRARARDALGSLDKSLAAQVELVCCRVGASAEPDARSGLQAAHDVPANWSDLLEAIANLDAALRRLRAQLLDADAMQVLGLAADSVQMHWLVLSTAPADLAGASVPDDMRYEWEALAEKSKSARGGVNQILANHDTAIAQFPASLLAGFMGFKPVGQL